MRGSRNGSGVPVPTGRHSRGAIAPTRHGPWAAGALLLLLLPLGCAHFRPVDPTDPDFVLPEGRGLLVLHVQTDWAIESLHVTGYEVGGPLEPGTHLWFVTATPGRHHFSKIRMEFELGRAYSRFPDKTGTFGFDVEAGQINYPGRLILEDVTRVGLGHIMAPAWSELGLRRRVVNRSAELLADLERDHPVLLERYPLRYTGHGVDRFIEAYEKARLDAAGAQARTDASR